MRTHSGTGRRDEGRELRGPPKRLAFPTPPVFPSGWSARPWEALEPWGAGKSSTWSPVEGACCAGTQGGSGSFCLAGQRDAQREAEAGLEALGFTKALFAACARRGVVLCGR